MILRKATLLALPVLLAAVSPSARALMIDDFTYLPTATSNLVMDYTNATAIVTPGYSMGLKVQIASPTATTLGGTRDMFLSQFDVINGDGFAYNNIIFGGRLNITGNNGGKAVGTVRWDGDTPELPNTFNTTAIGSTIPTSPLFPKGPDNVNINGLAPVNLTQNTQNPLIFDANAFALDLDFYSVGTVITLDVWSNDGTNTRHGSFTRCGIPGDCPDAQFDPLLLFFPFSSFSGGLDFTHVTAIKMTVDVPPSPTGNIDSTGLLARSLDTRFYQVPEPASLALAAAGLLGMGWSRRRTAR